jgi:hypothetical protein
VSECVCDVDEGGRGGMGENFGGDGGGEELAGELSWEM